MGKPRYSIDERHALTDSMIEEIARLVEAGNYIGIACAAVGVHRSTYNSWKSRANRVGDHLVATGQDNDPDYYPLDILPADVVPYDWQCYKLFWILETAEAKSEATAVLIIRKQMPEQWTAAMTYLERRFPDRWRKRQTFEQVTVEGTAGIDEQALIADPEAVRLVHEALDAIQRGGATPEREVNAPVEVPKLDQGRLLGPGRHPSSGGS